MTAAPTELAQARARIAELEKALCDCLAFVGQEIDARASAGLPNKAPYMRKPIALADDIRAALASLRRSAPASGEMREAIIAQCEAIVKVELAEPFNNGRNTRWALETILERFNSLRALRTPSDETGEEAGS